MGSMGEGVRQLQAAVASLPGIGPGSAEKLARLGIESLGDLLLHLPFRYQDRTRSVPLDELTAGAECVVTARIVDATVAFGRRRSLVVRLSDGSAR